MGWVVEKHSVGRQNTIEKNLKNILHAPSLQSFQCERFTANRQCTTKKTQERQPIHLAWARKPLEVFSVHYSFVLWTRKTGEHEHAKKAFTFIAHVRGVWLRWCFFCFVSMLPSMALAFQSMQMYGFYFFFSFSIHIVSIVTNVYMKSSNPFQQFTKFRMFRKHFIRTGLHSQSMYNIVSCIIFSLSSLPLFGMVLARARSACRKQSFKTLYFFLPISCVRRAYFIAVPANAAAACVDTACGGYYCA